MLAALLLACGPPPFVVHVLWPERVQIEVGAPVLYEGVAIGEVERIALRQEDPEQAAAVAVSIAIREPKVTLRRGDRFHLGSREGRPVVTVQPTRQPSEPLADGSTVTGVPPLLSRMEQRVGEAIESIGEAALEAVEEAIESLEESQAEEAREDVARPDPTPPG